MTRFYILRVALLCSGVMLASGAATANTWDVDYEASRIEFQVDQGGSPFTGAFDTFHAEIRLDPAAPEDGFVRVTIQTESVVSDSPDRDAMVRQEAWLGVEAHPVATFTSESLAHETLAQEASPALSGGLVEGAGNFVLAGMFALKGTTLPLTFPFRLAISDTGAGRRAVAQAEFAFSRFDYGVGTGKWADVSIVGEMVAIILHIEAVAP